MVLSRCTFLFVSTLAFSTGQAVAADLSAFQKLTLHCFNSAVNTYGDPPEGAYYPENDSPGVVEVFPGERDKKIGLYILIKYHNPNRTDSFFTDFKNKQLKTIHKRRNLSIPEVVVSFEVASVKVKVTVYESDGKLVVYPFIASRIKKNAPSIRLHEASSINDAVDSKAGSFQFLEKSAVEKVKSICGGLKRKIKENKKAFEEAKKRECEGKKPKDCDVKPILLDPSLGQTREDLKECVAASGSDAMKEAYENLLKECPMLLKIQKHKGKITLDAIDSDDNSRGQGVGE